MRRACWGIALLFAALPVRAAEPKVGDKMADLRFKDIRYLTRSLGDFPDARAFVLVFTDTACPVAQRYWPTLTRLEKDYRDRHVQFLAVNVGAEDSLAAVAAQALRHGVEFPAVKDVDWRCVKALGVQRVPEAVVLDAKRVLRYRGRIDDQYRVGGARSAPTKTELKDALDAVLAGKEVALTQTPVDGCLISMPELAEPKTPVTFAEHVAPILNRHCVECHRPDTAAPFSLLTYKQARSRADALAEVVADQSMPPWYAAPEHTDFVNRRGLSSRERETILQWVKAGTPLGDEKKLPAPPQFADTGRWLIGKPDLIVSTAEQELPAEGDVAYKYVVLTHLFLQETWLRGIQILPNNPRVVHHANLAYLMPGGKFSADNFLTGFVPGGQPMELDRDVAVRLPAGSMLVLQIHFVTTGKPEKCKVSVGLKYAEGTIQKRLHHVILADRKFAIPPGAPAHRVSASHTLAHEAVGVGLFSHMHVRGRDMTFVAHPPGGKSETLLVIPNYSFDWQMAYRWASGKKVLPKGTRIECFAHYDNSPFNPFNPDPKATVKDGPQTYHEMMNGFFFYTDAQEKLGLEIDGKTGRKKPARSESK